MIIESQVRALETLAGNLIGAGSIREKVRLADQIFATLAECEKLVEQFIVSDISKGGTQAAQPIQKPAGVAKRVIGNQTYKDMSLADIAYDLLQDRGKLHGLEIERLAKAGGFKSSAKHFQSYLSVALKRKGGFENTGKNNWVLNPDIQPDDRVRGDAVAVVARTSNAVPRKLQLHSWLKQNGPSTREAIMKGSGLPEGSASSIMSMEKSLFQKSDDGLWHAL